MLKAKRRATGHRWSVNEIIVFFKKSRMGSSQEWDRFAWGQCCYDFLPYGGEALPVIFPTPYSIPTPAACSHPPNSLTFSYRTEEFKFARSELPHSYLQGSTHGEVSGGVSDYEQTASESVCFLVRLCVAKLHCFLHSFAPVAFPWHLGQWFSVLSLWHMRLFGWLRRLRENFKN